MNYKDSKSRSCDNLLKDHKHQPSRKPKMTKPAKQGGSKQEPITSSDRVKDVEDMTQHEWESYMLEIVEAGKKAREKKEEQKAKQMLHYKSLSMEERVAYVKAQIPSNKLLESMNWGDLFDLANSSRGESDELAPDMAAFIGRPDLPKDWVGDILIDGSEEEQRLLFKNRKQ